MHRNPLAVVVLCLAAAVASSGCQSDQRAAFDQYEQQLRSRLKGKELGRSHYHEAMDHYHSGDYARAKRSLTQAVDVDPSNAQAWMSLGAAEWKLGYLYDAAVAFDRAAALLPGRYEPYFNLGMVFEDVGKYSRAIEHYETAMSIEPDQVETIENLARCLIKTRQQLRRAADLLEQALIAERRPEWRRWMKQQLVILNSIRSVNGDIVPDAPQIELPEAEG